MSDVDVKQINRLVAEFEQQGHKAQTLELGYKTYAQLFADDHFFAKVRSDPQDSRLKFYQDMKIQLLPNKHGLNVR
ncbi:hypothetical protein [Acinetobacter sp.]|uniref:hypothetical protein n=1 Tax=Acinetobacter sp. TaxID=472 RepID=UPI003890044D